MAAAEKPVYYNELLNDMPQECMLQQSHDMLRQDIQNCRLCPFAKLTKPLPLNNFDASIMIVGETPDDVLYDGKRGGKLGKLLVEMGIDLKDVYLTSLTKCSESQDSAKCAHHLTGEILTVRPSIIVCLGYKISSTIMQQPQFGQYVQIAPYTHALATYSFADAEEAIVLDTLRGQFNYILNVLQGMRTA
ncbi:putative uracil-DNA glycosylase [Paenibacillus sp. TCA20]|uniref:uracil-DNA glycosylase family protein n=1 Tax=Paenibacillus sp. TCA20 TaxID=1499968 RepID=UPI0004D3EA3A|nr:uracil-DNA glycosylase family protein [Paenibacillus sp. TCA20]GAK41956.1 putative uracil-DNA glycosylase [Paenibacillus sp. TCA20]